MSLTSRRSSLLNIDNWLDKCSNDEPDSMIYDPDYAKDIAHLRTKQKEPEIESLYQAVTDVCTKIGLPPNIVEERLADIDECLSSYITTIQKDVQDEFDKLCTYRQELLDKITKIFSDLHLPPYIPDENVTLLQGCKRLKTKFIEMNAVKQKRLTRLQQLRDRQTALCLILGIETPKVKTLTDIPSEDELNKLASTIVDLEKEEKRRKDKFCLMKEMISKCMDQMEYTPESDLEKKLVSGGLNLTEKHMLEMSNLHSKLEALYVKQEEKLKKLRDRLVSLYDRLDVNKEERDSFLDTHEVCKPSLMVEMEVEIERYEELKRQNIGKFIEKIKEELVVEYERCFVSQEQQDSFFSLSNVSGECSEELLDLYERELERIKRYYHDNKDILEKFQKWRDMWKQLIELEVKANDPNRFNNRGGQLLREEKKRKELQKGLPKIEKDLSALNDIYSAANQGARFKVFDSELDEFITGCWDELNTAKEEEKKERQRAKMTDRGKSQTRKPLQPQAIVKRTPTKRAAGAGITPTPSKLQCQRSVLGTPSSSTFRSNQLGQSGSVKKSVQKNIFQPQDLKSRIRSIDKSSIPVFNVGVVNQREKTTTNSHGSEVSALSLSEQEFEDMIVTCPASDKKTR